MLLLKEDSKGKTNNYEKLEQRLSKSEETNENLQGQIVKDTNTITELYSQHAIFNNELCDVKSCEEEAIDLYYQIITNFGGSAEGPPINFSAKDIFEQMNKEFDSLPEFVGQATDFIALSSTNNILDSLEHLGCAHFYDFFKRVFPFLRRNTRDTL